MNPGLTSYRFFAFFAVFLYHFGGLIEIGYMGVHAFFVLSGFLLTPILLEMKGSLSKRNYYINFYGRRALRIFPLYFFYLLIITITSYILINYYQYDPDQRLSKTIAQLPYALTYTYNFFAMSNAYQQTQTITHFWSLAVEEQFYLLWPFILMLVAKNNTKLTLMIIILAGPIIRFFTAWCAVHWPESFNSYTMTVYTFTLSSFDAFALGGFFALFVKQIKWFHLVSLIIGTLMVGILLEFINTGTLLPTALGYSPFMGDSYKYIWGYSVFSIIFACVLVMIKNRIFFPLLMENKVLVYFGTISYGLYVYHWPIMFFLSNTKVAEIFWPAKLLIILSITLIVASLSYEFLEKFFLNKKDLYFKRT